MSLYFSPYPGGRERHLQRRADNPLFPAERRQVTQADINQAQQEDGQELQQFLEEFQTLVQEITRLEPNVDSEIILHLKERLDMTYEQCAGMPGDQGQIKEALKRLLQVMMAAVRRHAGDDPKAQEKLDQEDAARAMHFTLQEYPLIADLLKAESPIPEDELVAALLSESAEALDMALQLFTPEQAAVLADQGRTLLDGLEDVPDEARARLEAIEREAGTIAGRQHLN